MAESGLLGWSPAPESSRVAPGGYAKRSSRRSRRRRRMTSSFIGLSAVAKADLKLSSAGSGGSSWIIPLFFQAFGCGSVAVTGTGSGGTADRRAPRPKGRPEVSPRVQQREERALRMPGNSDTARANPGGSSARGACLCPSLANISARHRHRWAAFSPGSRQAGDRLRVRVEGRQRRHQFPHE